MHLVGLYTYCKTMHGAYNIKLIKLGVKEIDWMVVAWIDVVRDKDKLRALVSMVMNKLVLKGVPTRKF